MTNEQIEFTLRYLLGSRYVPSVKPYISEIAGRPLVVGPQDIKTMNFDPDRINIRADEAGIITGFTFS